MNPLFFGRSPKSLLGVYHAPKANQARMTGVVLCYPFGQEYMRAHRAFRQMAILLSKAGFHVLRFDYSGTGDSSGDAGAVSLSDWIEDAGAAADELKETAEVQRVAFVGLRLGAAIAALAASGRSDVDQVVLWDPVVRGADYLTEIMEERHDSVGNSRLSVSGGNTIGVSGFPIGPSLRAELAAINVLHVTAPQGRSRRLVVASQERAEYHELWRADVAGAETSFQLVPSEGSWNVVDDFGGALIPVLLIQNIVANLSKELR